ncbi:hypothetical protein SAMN04487894_12137 [Niabella drilacis]|uniref:Uncharacterized protein n=1 Tax=Niabella drilacis (strain DSM 25811 / CCM 8410 / CCUG 62505 / LMG 26954 / E90) TaxID=1285928 RepID=A0A1G7A7X1_NIADE|nr:hypothetical protein SAMN04487894_12137 [Niabella drilacis]
MGQKKKGRVLTISITIKFNLKRVIADSGATAPGGSANLLRGSAVASEIRSP